MLGKILLLAAIFAVAYYGYRYYIRREQVRKAEDAARVQKGGAGQTMSKCAVCGSYVAPGAGKCGRADCPY